MVEGTLGILLRLTARISAGLLCAGFFAYAAQHSAPGGWRAFGSTRRWWPVLLALSHSGHLALIFVLWSRQGVPPLKMLAPLALLGGTAFLFIYVAALHALGLGISERLAQGGLYYVWAIFLIALGSKAAHSPLHAAFTVVLLAALVWRVRAGRRKGALAQAAAQ